MGLFFVSWELWQQMTFVLAGAIVIVFCMGLVKLWWNNRLMRKQEILDEEKKARLTEMRSAGLRVKRGNDIPFGVRAIQSGIEVAGIWISRPPSPNLESNVRLASSTTLVGMDSNSEKKGKFVEDFKTPSPASSNLDRTGADGSISRGVNLYDSPVTSPSATPSMPQFTSQYVKHSPQATPFFSEDTLRKLETNSDARHFVETYVPTSALRHPRHPSQRSSASSSGESTDSQQHATRSVSGRSYSSSRSSRLYAPRNMHEGRTSHSSVPPEVPEKDHRDPLDTPTWTPTGSPAFSHEAGEIHAHQHHINGLSVPEPTFGPGDMHANRSSRRVNAGFEVLPAGTFGSSPEIQSLGGRSHPYDSESKRGRQSNTMRKQSFNQLPRGGQPF